MKKTDFLIGLQDILECDNLDENSPLAFTSMEILSVIAFLDENFNKQFRAVDLRNVKSVNELIILIGEPLS